MTERTDSHHWQHTAVTGALLAAVDLPEHVRLEPGDLPYWEGVLAEFPRNEWSQHQLELAAMLARAMADLHREQTALRNEGSVVATASGTVKSNPRSQSVTAAAALVLSIRRSLAMNARARVGDSRTIAGQRRRALAIQDVIDGIDDPDCLLARPGQR